MMRTADGVGSPFLRGVSQVNWGGPRPADPPEVLAESHYTVRGLFCIWLAPQPSIQDHVDD